MATNDSWYDTADAVTHLLLSMAVLLLVRGFDAYLPLLAMFVGSTILLVSATVLAGRVIVGIM